jgi:hypothetical protein
MTQRGKLVLGSEEGITSDPDSDHRDRSVQVVYLQRDLFFQVLSEVEDDHLGHCQGDKREDKHGD